MARARRSLDGLSVGDAFGERFFGPPLKALARIEARTLPPGPWRWTDDTAMGLSVVDELAAGNGIDPSSLAARFAARHHRDPMRGYGGGAHRILAEISQGVPYDVAAGSVFGGQGSMGNGAAMRVAPIGAYFADDPVAVVEHARRSAVVTHAHPEGQAGAIAIAVAAAAAVKGEGDYLAAAFAHTPPGPTRDGIARACELPAETSVGRAAEELGAGEQVISSDTVPFSLWCATRHRDDYAEALWATVAGLGDRDTTCAIVGGIVALAPGASVPREWLGRRESVGEE